MDIKFKKFTAASVIFKMNLIKSCIFLQIILNIVILLSTPWKSGIHSVLLIWLFDFSSKKILNILSENYISFKCSKIFIRRDFSFEEGKKDRIYWNTNERIRLIFWNFPSRSGKPLLIPGFFRFFLNPCSFLLSWLVDTLIKVG